MTWAKIRAIPFSAVLVAFSTVAVAKSVATSDAKSEPPPPEIACAFLNPIYFGASISAGYGGIPDGIAARLASLAGGGFHGSNYNPIMQLQVSYLKTNQSIDLSEMTGRTYNAGDGAKQMQKFLSTKRGQSQFQNASMIGSVDGFYWAAAEKNCAKTVKQIDQLTDLAKKEGRVLVLGNVPIEDPNTVDFILRKAGWTPPRKECVAKFNAELKVKCKAEDQCYLLDLKKMVSDLNREKSC